MVRQNPYLARQDKPRRSWWLLGALAGCGLLAVGLVAVWWLRGDQAPTPIAEVEPAVPAAPVVAAPPPGAPLLQPAYSTPPRLTPSLERLAAQSKVKAIIASADNHAILWGKDERSPAPIASMTKLMTGLVALEQLERRPELTLETPITVSLAACQMGGSQLWLEANSSYPLRQMLLGLMLASANDAAHAVAENLAPDGRSETFVALMNRRARELGLERARFFNPHGMPADQENLDNAASPLDYARLALYLQGQPLLMEMVGTFSAPFVHTNGKVIEMYNHNRLLRNVSGVTGMKTGFINRSGFCSTVTATRGGRTMVVVAMGFDTRVNRDQFVTELLDWGFRQPVSQPTMASASPLP